MGPTALLPLRRKLCYGFLSPLKIHRPRPGFNPQTLGPVASTLITSPPRATFLFVAHLYYLARNVAFKWSALCFLCGRRRAQMLDQRTTIPTEAFCGLSCPIQASFRKCYYIRTRHLSFTSFITHYLLFTLKSDGIEFQLLSAPLRKA
jgi:hypothetical protein